MKGSMSDSLTSLADAIRWNHTYTAWPAIYQQFMSVYAEVGDEGLREFRYHYPGACETATLLELLRWNLVRTYYGKTVPQVRKMKEILIRAGLPGGDHPRWTDDIDWQEKNSPYFAEFKKTPDYQDWLKLGTAEEAPDYVCPGK
jgi:hypothetical protein